MAAPSIKRFLLDQQEDVALLKQWAMLAKKAKDFFESNECKLLHALFDSCFTKALFSADAKEQNPKIAIRFLDLLNTLLATSTSSDERRTALVYCI